MTEQTQENVTTPATPAQENAEQNTEPKKRIRRTKAQRLAELQRKAAELEAEIREDKDKKATHDKTVIGGWVRAIGKRNPEFQTKIFDYLGRLSMACKLGIPKHLQEEVSTAMRQAAAAKAAKQHGGEQ